MTTTNTAAQVEALNTVLFPNLFASLSSKVAKQLEDFKSSVNEQTDLSGFNTWYFENYLPKGKRIKDFKTIEDIKTYLNKRADKHAAKQIAKHLAHLLEIEKAPEFKYFNISIEWKRSQMWGANPRANGYDYNGHYDSGSVGGCGYDKLSTAVANVLNQSLALKKALYLEREKNLNDPLRELFGYGSGYDVLPYFEGGVGVSCYPNILSKIGFTFRQTANGKSFDAFEITKNA